MLQDENNLIWIDLEMTGLNPERDRIVEIATIVTDKQLTILGEGPVLAIHQTENILNLMDSWVSEQHTRSGLVERIKASSVNELQAERLTIEFLQRYVQPGKSPMCGNTICMDRRFLVRYMPELEKYFHYRHIDVSTIKELAKRWAKPIYDGLQKESKHLALDDIKDSIEELRYYREHFIKY